MTALTTSTAPSCSAHTPNPPKSPQSRTQSQNPLLHSLQTKGYCIIPNALPPSLLQRLRKAAKTAKTLARQNRWPHLRTLPKQFPPWSSFARDGIWGVQHLLHPDMPSRLDFARCYFGDEIIGPVKQLLEVGDGEKGEKGLVMELFNLLVTPPRDFELRWHRDGVSFDGLSVQEEERLLGLEEILGEGRKVRRPFHAQYNIPVAEERDASLVVVPGSHLRPRTEEEVRILERDAYAECLPEMQVVELEPGDVAFYDNNIIHRGVYKKSVERLTLHGSVGDVNGGEGRARNVLQHGVGDWILHCHFDGLENERVRKRADSMQRRLLDLGGRVGKEGTQALHKD